MDRTFVERIEAYPELKKHVEKMLDVVENIGGKADKANDAEFLVVDNMRKIGGAALEEWATQREKAAISKWSEENPTSIKHGKKKSAGGLPSGNERS